MDWSSFSIGNAAGFVKGPGEQFDQLLRSAATDITIGSITTEPRAGNPGSTYHLLPDGTSVNALGLPNPGLEATKRVAESMSERTHAAGKKLRWSVAGFTIEEYVELAQALFEYGFLELNLGCPNVWGEAGQKPIASFDLKLMEAIITAMERFHPDLFFDIKLSPYSDPSMIPRVIELVRNRHVGKIIACNTYPNAVVREGAARKLDTPGGFGGMAGNGFFPIALGQVAQFVNAAKYKHGQVMRIIGAGGIDSGERVSMMVAEGAAGVQIGTAYGEQGARIFSEIIAEI